MKNIHSNLEVLGLVDGREVHTKRELIEVKFAKSISKGDYFYDNYIMWFQNKYIPNPILINKKGQITGVITTVNVLLDFLTVKREFEIYNGCLEQIMSKGIYYDKARWRLIS